MNRFVALIRAVNVGGAGKLPMAALRSMCLEAGFFNAETYLASGNAVFASDKNAASVKALLEDRLTSYAGKAVGVFVRTAAEVAQILEDNPFPDREPSKTFVLFLDAPPPANTLDTMIGRAGEEARLGRREIYIAYPSGMGRSKLNFPAMKAGTARNLNTVAALVKLSGGRCEAAPDGA
jgi:uncharacterized protein (DUF1697 family)